MKKRTHTLRNALIALIVIALAVGGIYAWLHATGETSGPARDQAGAQPAPGSYADASHGFSFKVPDGYSVRAFTDSTSDPAKDFVVVQDTAGQGVQIAVTPFEDAKELTAEMIKNDIPDMKVADARAVDVGDGYTGIAFASDNAAYGGDSREIWFVYHGALYQLSTYARSQSLLEQVFGTWRFTK